MDPSKIMDLYQRLNISKTASEKEIKSAYIKSALKYHPDTNKNPNAHNQFLAISQAFDVLRNKETRKLYDSTGIKKSSITFEEEPWSQGENSFDKKYSEKETRQKEWYKRYDEMYQVYNKFSTNIDDLVALCIDETHEEYGHLGKVLFHDWLEYGIIGIEFSDGKKFDFDDGVCVGDAPSGVIRYYRHNNVPGRAFDNIKKSGPKSFLEKYLELGVGDEALLRTEYRALFNESFFEDSDELSNTKNKFLE